MTKGTIKTTVVIQSSGDHHATPPIQMPPDIRAMRYLLSRIDRDPVTGCWHWRGAKTPGGYGMVGGHLKASYASPVHRVSKQVFEGWRPTGPGEQIRHQCGSRDCINPWHSLTGTAKENWNDRRHQGTGGYKLVEADVCAIRAALRDGVRGRVLAKRYGVNEATISDIKLGKTWAHLTC